MLGRIALTLALGTAFAAAQAIPDRPEKLNFPPISFEVPKVKDFKAKLKNGIPVFLAPDPAGVPLVRLTVQWRGGGYLDPKGKEGLASLFGSQLARGGTAKTDIAKLEDRLEALAASLSSSCGDTGGSLGLQVQEKDLAEGLELFMQTLTEPAFASDRFDLAKRTSRQGLDRRNDAVTSIAQYQMAFLLFGESHFQGRADTTAASLEAITREDLKAFHDRLLHPGNLVVSVSGRFDRKAMLDKLNSTLGALKPGKDAQTSPKAPAPDFVRKPGLYVVDKTAPQAMVEWAFPGLRRSDPDWHAAAVMNHILGGSFTSRLMKRIRSDEGLTYGVRTSLGEGAHHRGDLRGSLQTKNRSVAYALRIALAEMKRLQTEIIPEAELKAIKDGLIEAFPSQWSGRNATALRFATESLAGWPEDWWVDYRQKVQAVGAADVQRMAKKLLDLDHMVILAVGAAAEIEAGDPDHPGRLAETAALPLQRLPLRDPATMQPLK